MTNKEGHPPWDRRVVLLKTRLIELSVISQRIHNEHIIEWLFDFAHDVLEKWVPSSDYGRSSAHA